MPSKLQQKDLRDIINEYFGGDCDVAKREDRIGFLAVILAQFNDGEYEKIKSDIKELDRLMTFARETHQFDEVEEHIKGSHGKTTIEIKCGKLDKSKVKSKKDLADALADILIDAMGDDDGDDENA